MAIGLALPAPLPLTTSHVPHHHADKPSECHCGARAFYEERQRRLTKRIAPMGVASVMAMRAMAQHANEKHPQDEDEEENHATPTRKRSLWRKLLGKGPKCICDKLEKEREANRPKLLQIPSEYAGCLTVRVAGKRVAYTREMQQVKRLAYKPMDAIAEEDCDQEDV